MLWGLGAAALIAALGAGQFLRQWDRYQWDFRVYWAAGAAANAGLNPYDAAARRHVLPSVDPTLPFVYPPLAVFPFRALAWVPFAYAQWLWLGLKLVALVGLLWMWNRFFVPLLTDTWAPLFLVAGLSGTLAVDLVTGNISLFEQLGLWSAFLWLLQGRAALFAAFVIGVAQWKLVPIAFLTLLLAIPSRPRLGGFLAAVGAFGALLCGSAWAWPEGMKQFLEASVQLPERGHLNPSLASLSFDVVEAMGYPWRPLPAGLAWGVYGMAVLGLLTPTVLTLRRMRKQNPLQAVFFCCATFAVIAPRMMGYSLILLLPVALHALREGWGAGRSNTWLLLLLFFPVQTILPVFQLPKVLAQEYLVYFMSLALWWVYWRASVRLTPHQQVV